MPFKSGNVFVIRAFVHRSHKPISRSMLNSHQRIFSLCWFGIIPGLKGSSAITSFLSYVVLGSDSFKTFKIYVVCEFKTFFFPLLWELPPSVSLLDPCFVLLHWYHSVCLLSIWFPFFFLSFLLRSLTISLWPFSEGTFPCLLCKYL